MAVYEDFRVTTVDTNLSNKTVTISTTFDIDAETVNDATVQLLDRVTRNLIEYQAEVNGKTIVITFKEWPRPNVDYILSVQSLKDVLGDVLAVGFRRKIVFASTICSTLEVTYPAYDEVISDLKAAWTETPPTGSPVINSYYIEISTENAFFNIVKHSEVVGRTELDLTDLPDGQYYIRVRAQQGDEYGDWSEVSTFVIQREGGQVPASDPSEEIYTPEINVIMTPADGETPTSILIEFDHAIDPASLSEIVVIRRPV